MSFINVGFDNNSPQAIDRSYGTLKLGATTPYISVAAAIAAVNVNYRHRGKTVSIDTGSGLVEYWWRVDTQDSSLVPKIRDMQVIDFVIGDLGPLTPASGTTVYTDPALINCFVDAFLIEGAEVRLQSRTGTTYAIYSTVAGTISLINGLFSQDTWYKIRYRQL